jgi:mRNA-degrading endonuclease toxin of MazEF toxin-antitoxin module
MLWKLLTLISLDGSLSQDSNIRTEKITTIDHRIRYKVGSLKPERMKEVIRKTVEIIHYFKYQDSLTPCLSISRLGE